MLFSSAMDTALSVAYIVVCVAICIMFTIAGLARVYVFFKYLKSNKIEPQNGETGEKTARKLLDDEGLTDVQVKKSSFLRAVFWGNSYSCRKKTIFLRRGIVNKSSVTAIAIASQKVALAKMDRDGNKKLKLRDFFAPLTIFAPFFFIPIVLIGVIVDIVVMNTIGWVSILAVCIGLVLLIFAFSVTILTLPVEKQAVKMALENIAKKHLLNDEETIAATNMFKGYIVGYVADLIIAILSIIKMIIKLIMLFQDTSD